MPKGIKRKFQVKYKIGLIISLGAVLVALVILSSLPLENSPLAGLFPKAPSEAAPPNKSDIETYRGQVITGTASVVNFTTFPNENSVILSFQGRNGGEKTLKVYDPSNALISTITVPAEVSSVWSTSISALQPSTQYRVEINISFGRTKYTLYVNHCPDGNCF